MSAEVIKLIKERQPNGLLWREVSGEVGRDAILYRPDGGEAQVDLLGGRYTMEELRQVVAWGELGHAPRVIAVSYEDSVGVQIGKKKGDS